MSTADESTSRPAATAVKRLAPDNNPVAQAAMDAIDPLELLLPRGWRSATVSLESAGDGVRVKKLETTVDDDNTPAPYRDLGFDRASWVAAASAGFSRLRAVLGDQGLPSDVASALYEHQHLTGGNVTLFDANGQPRIEVPICKQIARGQLLNEDVLGILGDSLPEWDKQWKDVDDALEDMRGWRYDASRTSIVFEFADRTAVVPAQVLGSYSTTEFSWCWSWANRSYERADYSRLLAFRDRAFGYIGMGSVWRPGCFSEQGFMSLVAQLVTSESGGATVFNGAAGDGLEVYYALMDTAGLLQP